MLAILKDSSCDSDQSFSSKPILSSLLTAKISMKKVLPAVLQGGKTNNQYLAFEHVKNEDLAKLYIWLLSLKASNSNI